MDTSPPACVSALAAAPRPGTAARGRGDQLLPQRRFGAPMSPRVVPPAGTWLHGVPPPVGPARSPDMLPWPSLHPGGRASSAWHGGMSPCPHRCPGLGPFCTPSPTSSPSSCRHPRSTDGSALICSHEAAPPSPDPRRTPCPQLKRTQCPRTQAGSGAAVVGVTPSLGPADSAPAPLGSASASAGASWDLSVFLSPNAGFLVKSCSSVAVTTLLQFPSRDVFLCCDRDAGRRPPAAGVLGVDGEGLLPRGAGPRCCPWETQLGSSSGVGLGRSPRLQHSPGLAPATQGTAEGPEATRDTSLIGLSRVLLPSRATM